MRLDPLPRIPNDAQQLNRALSDLFRLNHQTVNALSEGRASARYGALTAPPTAGTYAQGDYIDNSNPTKLGIALSRYVIYGWKRLTNGSTHVLNIDWVEDRRLTGD
jgi:hypothetical protein